MESIKYLVHTTTIHNAEKILTSGYIYTGSDLKEKGIKPRGSAGFEDEKGNVTFDDEMNGVYMTPKFNNYATPTPTFKQHLVDLYFSPALLSTRTDWYINSADNFGTFGVDSVTRDTVDEMDIDVFTNAPYPEVVFQNKVCINKLLLHIQYGEDINIEEIAYINSLLYTFPKTVDCEGKPPIYKCTTLMNPTKRIFNPMTDEEIDELKDLKNMTGSEIAELSTKSAIAVAATAINCGVPVKTIQKIMEKGKLAVICLLPLIEAKQRAGTQTYKILPPFTRDKINDYFKTHS